MADRIAPPSPEQLFAEFHALRAAPAASAAQYDALSKRARAAKAAYKRAGDAVRAQQCADVQGYLARSRPRDEPALTASALDAQLAAIAGIEEPRRRASELRALAQRISAQRERDRRTASDARDEDHDELTDGEGALIDLAAQWGVALDWD